MPSLFSQSLTFIPQQKRFLIVQIRGWFCCFSFPSSLIVKLACFLTDCITYSDLIFIIDFNNPEHSHELQDHKAFVENFSLSPPAQFSYFQSSLSKETRSFSPTSMPCHWQGSSHNRIPLQHLTSSKPLNEELMILKKCLALNWIFLLVLVRYRILSIM